LKIENEQDIIKLIKEDKWMMSILEDAKSLNLPDWWVCAGFVRSKIWDVLHRFEKRTTMLDIDVIYFDANSIDEEVEKKLENQLKGINPNIPWSVKNEARMHVVNNFSPYLSSVDAISKFPETATALGLTMDEQNNVRLTAPHGIEDVINLVLRPTPYFEENNDRAIIYEERIAKKQWKKLWNKLKVVHIQHND